MAEKIAHKYNVGIEYIDWPDMALKIESGDTVFDDTKLRKACGVRYNMTFKKWCSKRFK